MLGYDGKTPSGNQSKGLGNGQLEDVLVGVPLVVTPLAKDHNSIRWVLPRASVLPVEHVVDVEE